MGGMKKVPPVRYLAANWSSYNSALRTRGSLLIRRPVGAFAALRGGRDKEMRRLVVALAVPTCSPMRRSGLPDDQVLFALALRQTTGVVASLLEMANLGCTLPDYSTLCRRRRALQFRYYIAVPMVR
ncbi:Transposase DDE domain-containing protein [Puniceibacterium sediminis]|uniref:Transposase DDE domain-containing protein n=1 Tax=Puniceibacterium sediminis TaxID=1608407 RepID=A0A238XKK2_9RHOB|nr:Transposase DDE domain-containing protein [Puniceibacterium sediminis]